MKLRADLSARVLADLIRVTRSCFEGISELRVTKLEHGRLWIMVVRDQEETPPSDWRDAMIRGRIEVILRGEEEDGVFPIPARLHFHVAPDDLVHSPKFLSCTLLPAPSPRGTSADYTVRRLAELTSHRLIGEPVPEVAIINVYLADDAVAITVSTR